MVATFRRGGVTPVPAAGGGFAPPTGPVHGNALPPDTGKWPSTYYGEQDKPGPHPVSQPMGGTSGGGNDGVWGPDPRAPFMSPFPRRVAPTVEGQTSSAAGDAGGLGYTGGRPLGYGYGIPRTVYGDSDGASNAGQLARPGGDPLPTGRQSFWRGGIQGFNDKLTAKDRHAYWDTGYQRQGTDFTPASAPPNTYNDPKGQYPTAELRTVNRTVSYQKGTDTTRNQDDLSREYTWLGEQGSGWTPVPGGVPGLYQPYGSRGGVPYPIVDPTGGQGGREQVWSGPPHGLHSLTYPDVGDTLNRYLSNVQMRPVRIDRPANSPISGQAYSQTVEYQGSTGGAGGPVPPQPEPGRTGHQPRTRGWAGAQRPDRRRGR